MQGVQIEVYLENPFEPGEKSSRAQIPKGELLSLASSVCTLGVGIFLALMGDPGFVLVVGISLWLMLFTIYLRLFSTRSNH